MTAAPPLPATEAADPRTEGIDGWESPAVLAALWQSQLAAVAAVGPALPALGEAADAAAARLDRAGGRLAYAGAGTSGRIAAQDGAELAPTFGWPEERISLHLAGGAAALLRGVEGAEDDRAAGAAAGAALGGADVLVAVAASGRTPYTLAALEAARAGGALCIGIANVAGSPLLAAAEHAILLATGAEVVAGSTRLAAGTAQKVALNLFSTLVMVRLGHVHRGRMVDLQTSNDKLRARAARMVAELAGCDAQAAGAALAAAGGSVKRALLVLRGLEPAAAAALLARHRGHLGAALTALGREVR